MSEYFFVGKRCAVAPLSAADAIACIREAGAFRGRLSLPDEIAGLAETLSEYGALCAFCLVSAEGRVFSTPEAALAALTLDELCDVCDEYRLLDGKEEGRSGRFPEDSK